MNHVSAVTRGTEITARACARVLGTLFGKEGAYEAIDVHEEPKDPWEAVDFPVVTVEIAFTQGITGNNLFLLRPEQARALATAMMGLDEPMETGDLSEIELSAVSEAMNQMMGSVSTDMAEAIGVPTDIAPPRTTLLHARDDAGTFPPTRYAAAFTLRAGDLEAAIISLVPEDFAETLVRVFTSSEVASQVLSGRNESVAVSHDDMLEAVDRTARVTAESAGQVLSTLIGGDASATLPSVESDPDDPLGKLSYPLLTVEVSYVSGVTGANLFVLSPAQAATLAAVMMGLDEPMGDGLTDLEMSAVSEAMNQMMGAATNVLADTLSLDIEVAPPVCKVMESADQARAEFPHPKYCTRFRLVSDRLTADVVQLVPLDFAQHLRQAFAAADLGRAAVAVEHANPAHAGNLGFESAARARPGALDPETLHDVHVRVSAELGRARLPIGQVVNLAPGAIVELDRLPSDPIDVLVNGRPFASARLVLVDGEYAVRIVQIAPQLAAA